MEKDLHVGIMGDLPLAITGYGKVARYLSEKLVALGSKVTFCGVQYGGMPAEFHLDGNDYTMFEGNSQIAMHKYIENQKPDVLIHIRDNWVFTPKYFAGAYSIYPQCRANNVKLVLYSPVQSHPVPPDFANVAVSQCDFQLTMTKFGRDVFLSQGVGAEKVDYVYHGVDTSVYKAMDQKSCREHFGFDTEKPLVGVVGMNMDYRKMLPLHMVIFKEVLKDVPDAELCMWTERVSHWDLDIWKNNLHLGDRIYFPAGTKTQGVTEEEMAMLYNCFDVLLHVSASEGFGMPLLEAKACRIPIVCTDHPVLHEVLGKWPEYAMSRLILPTVWGSLEYLVDIDDAARKVVNILKKGKDYAPAGTDDVARDVERFSWKRAAIKLDSLLQDIAGRYQWVRGQISDDHLGSSLSHESFLRDEILEKKHIFVDVGAHAGRWAVRAQRYYDQVYAFEPHPETFKVLEKNIEQNKITGVELIYMAVTEKGKEKIVLHEYQYHGWHSVLPQHMGVSTVGKSLEVPAICLDAFFNGENEGPDVIKIDTEGNEAAVVAGALKTINRHKPKLIIEIHDNDDIPVIKKLLEGTGYTRVEERTDTLTPTQTYLVISDPA